MEARFEPNSENPDETDLVLNNTQEIDFSGLGPMDCVVMGVGLLRNHLGQALTEVLHALDLNEAEDPRIPVSIVRELLESLEVTASGPTTTWPEA